MLRSGVLQFLDGFFPVHSKPLLLATTSGTSYDTYEGLNFFDVAQQFFFGNFFFIVRLLTFGFVFFVIGDFATEVVNDFVWFAIARCVYTFDFIVIVDWIAI
jgi:hypothetical protein